VNQSKYALMAGLFILISVAAVFAIVARIAKERADVDDAHQYIATFAAGQDISGLDEGAQVRLIGKPIGRVESVEIVMPEGADAHIKITFSVPRKVRLKSQSPIIEAQTSFTGGAWLNIRSLGTGEELPDNSSVEGQSVGITAMLDAMQTEMQATLASLRSDAALVTEEFVETGNAIEEAADEATTLLSRLEEKLDPSIQEYDTFMAEATGVMADIRSVFGDSGEDIRQTLASLNTLTDTIDQRLPGTLDRVDLALDDISSLSDEITGFVDQAEQSLDGINALTRELDSLTAETRATLGENRVELNRSVTNARRTIIELRGMVEDLRANPSRLIWSPDPSDLHNLDLYATARQYATAAEDLQAAAQALRDASVTSPDDAQQLDALRDDLMQQFDHFDQVQQEVWQRFER